MRRTRALAILGILGVLLVLPALPASAAILTVNTLDDELNSDGDCSLQEAANAANTDQPWDACGAGSGADTIVVPAGTYVLESELVLSTEIVLSGAGAGMSILDGGGDSRVLNVSGSPVTVDGVSIQNGNANANGGGIFNEGVLTVMNSVVSDNDPFNCCLGGGGGIRNDGTMTVDNTTVRDNGSNFGGGVFNNGNLTVTSSTFSNNFTAAWGGAILNNNGNLTVTNSTFSGNVDNGPGGGIRQNVGQLTVMNSTFTGNSGGIFNGDSAANATIGGTILANSTATSDCEGQFNSTGYNLAENMSGCVFTGVGTGNLTGTDPVLGPLADNGGPTETHALLFGSPALDAGDPACPPPATDQRGVARPQGPVCDIGAFEATEAIGIFIDDVAVTEGPGGTSTATLTISLSGPSTQAITVDFATANGTATAPADYRARTGSVSFTPGMVSRPVPIRLVPDALDEPDETFFVNLSNAAGATIADGQGQVTILDDDEPALPVISINDVSVVEGPAGTTTTAKFTVTLSMASSQTVTVDWATANGTAVSPADYKAQPLTTLTFNPGQTSKTVSVSIRGDGAVEPNETFFVNLSNPLNATIGDGQGQGTILNDD